VCVIDQYAQPNRDVVEGCLMSCERAMTLNHTILICKIYPEDSTLWGSSCTIDLIEKKKTIL
jgi:hypothetical protein